MGKETKKDATWKVSDGPEVRIRLLELAGRMSTGYKLDLDVAYKQLADLFLDYRTGSGGDAP